MLPPRTGPAADTSWSAPTDTELLVRTFAANEHCFYNLHVAGSWNAKDLISYHRSSDVATILRLNPDRHQLEELGH